ncbi:type I-F CRISPR-associated protein Csy2 [Cycloclasticus pugetii]|jgi:CRISPR-associated protein Csy2|uniref:type I-F CRISPR-associated protein Csy2 n=1 Tax=Cycloclasticus pugetii TaxID=34068 RepID=UPI000375EE9A|nr:type I-F CRISPR-associated protein Csy2 [Cycloclasticus pugetii]
MKDIVLIPNIKIHNANALSSPYTIGFPAMTAWLGFMHALERKIRQAEFKDIKFTGVIVSCLELDLQTYKGQGDYVHSIIATSNPLDKSGKRPSFIEEARCDIEVTIAIECELGIIDYEKFTQLINNKLHTMKIASGDITSFKPSQHKEVDNNKPRELTKYLMPGFCLVTRQDLMQSSMDKGADAIDAMLDYLKITTDIEVDENHKVSRSKAHKKEEGWIVPIAIGYQGISELGSLKNTRDLTTPHRFAESVVTLGEFKMPYHFDTLDEMVWRYQEYEKNDLYLCQNNYSINQEKSKL